jgi:hypothetical protein
LIAKQLFPVIPRLSEVTLRRIQMFALEGEDSELILRGRYRAVYRSDQSRKIALRERGEQFASEVPTSRDESNSGLTCSAL